MKLKIKNLMIDIINRCNLNCVHCYNRTTVDRNEILTVEEIDFIVKKTVSFGLERLYLTGGEPLLHPQLIDILSYLTHKYTNIEIGITTNGLLLTNDIVSEIIKCGKVVIQISVDGTSERAYESIRGIGTFPRFIQGFNVLKNSDILKKNARTCISKMNIEEIPNIYKMCVEAGIEPSFLFVNKMGNAINRWDDLILNDAQKISVIDKINLLNKKHNMKISPPTPAYKCNFTQLLDRPDNDYGEWGLSVQTNGNVTCCQFLYDHPIGNIFNDSVEDMFKGDVFAQLMLTAKKRKQSLDSSEKCNSCFIQKMCGLGCMGISMSNDDPCEVDNQCAFRQAYALFKNCNFIN